MKRALRFNTNNRFINYVTEVWPAIAVLVLITLMTHGSILFSQRIGIDTEDIIRGMSYFDKDGRQGIVWLADILEISWFSPYMAQVLTILFMICAPVCFGFLFYIYSGQKALVNVTLILLGTSYIVSPFWTEQIYFQNQSAQVTCSCALTAVSIMLAEEGLRALRTRWYYILGALLLMQVTFASYQVLIMLYVTGVVMVFLCSVLKENRSLKRQIQWIASHAGIFLIGLAAYWLTAKCFYGTEMDYLSGQIGWSRLGIKNGIRSCISAVWSAMKNNPPYYTGFYGIFALGLFVTAVYKGTKNGWFRKAWGRAVLFYLAVLFLAGTPFVFCVLYGGDIWARMQLVFPLAQGCMLYLMALLLCDNGGRETSAEMQRRGIPPEIRNNLTRGIAVLLAAAVLKNMLINMSYCNRMYYTDEWRYQYDRQLAHDICRELEDYVEENGYDKSLYTNLVFVGIPEIPYNEVCLKGQVIGSSFFEWDMRFKGIHKTRIINFMRIAGYPIEPVPSFGDGAEAAYFTYFEEYFGERVDAMPSFPEAGSIQYLEAEDIGLHYLVIKLGGEWRSAFN